MVFIVGLIFLSVGYLHASGRKSAEVKLPPVIDLFQHPVYASESDYSLGEFQRVRMWGWSGTGNVAYSTERFVDGIGSWRIDYFISDTIKNEVVFHMEIDSTSPEFDLPFVSYNDADFEAYIMELFEVRMDIITATMKNYGIRERHSDFFPFPFQNNNIHYNVVIENVERVENWFFPNNISSYSVALIANEKSKTVKIVNGQFGTVGLFICGYMTTPIKNRALIVLAEERFVYEGTELFYVFLGCDLVNGF
jgi:hypothetical protein